MSPTIFWEKGYRLFFFSREEPRMHVHVICADGEAKYWLEPDIELAKNLNAEIDDNPIEAYRGTVSLPFEPGEHKRIAVKIVDDRGIESLKILDLI